MTSKEDLRILEEWLEVKRLEWIAEIVKNCFLSKLLLRLRSTGLMESLQSLLWTISTNIIASCKGLGAVVEVLKTAGC